MNTRAQTAKASHVHAGAETQERARAREVEVAEALRAAGVEATHVGGLGAKVSEFDVVVGTPEAPRALLEVKTLLLQGNDKVTVHPRSLRRKLRLAGSLRVPCWLVAVDDRNGRDARRVYVRAGVGSWRLHNMDEVSSLSALASVVA